MNTIEGHNPDISADENGLAGSLRLIRSAKRVLEKLRDSPTGTQETICETPGRLSLSEMSILATGLNSSGSLKFAGQVGPGCSNVGYVMELEICPNGDVIILV